MVCCLPGSDISATWFVQLKDGSALLAFCLFVFMCRTYPSILRQKKKNHEQTRPAEYFSVLAFLCKGPGLAQSSYLSLTSSVHL